MALSTVMVISTHRMPPSQTASTARMAVSAFEVRITGTRPISLMSRTDWLLFNEMCSRANCILAVCVRKEKTCFEDLSGFPVSWLCDLFWLRFRSEFRPGRLRQNHRSARHSYVRREVGQSHRAGPGSY